MAAGPENVDEVNTSRATDFFRRLLNHYLGHQREQIDWGGFKSKIREISGAYKSMYIRPVSSPDYSNNDNLCAYMYLYFMQSCFMTYKTLLAFQSELKAKVKSQDTLNVCCLGGGPGTDLVALIRFLQDHHLYPAKLNCTVLDLYDKWEDTWTSMQEILRSEYKGEFSVEYRRCDFLEESSLGKGELQAIQRSDIVTFISAFSPLFHSLQQAPGKKLRLLEICKHIKDQALVLYIDNFNRSKVHVEFTKSFADPANLTVIKEIPPAIEEIDFEMYQKYKNLCHFYNKCEGKYKPMSSSVVQAILLRKKKQRLTIKTVWGNWKKAKEHRN